MSGYKTKKPRPYWKNLNMDRLKKYIEDCLQEKKKQGLRYTYQIIAEELNMSISTLFKYVHLFELEGYFKRDWRNWSFN